MFQNLKDKALAVAIRTVVNERYHEFGNAEECDIDTEANSLVLRALLHGEKETVTAFVERYDIRREDGETYLVVEKISASREWLSTLLAKLVTGKRFRLPTPVALLL